MPLATRTPIPRHDEPGQTVVFTVMVIVALLAMAAMTVDGGRWLLENRNAQGVADASALAAAREFSTGGSPEAMAQQYVDLNPDDQVALADVAVAGSSVRVDVDRDSDSFLAGIVGVDSAYISASAEASALQASGVPGALPFAFMDGGYTPGVNEGVKVEKNLGPGNRGIVRLQMEPSCQVGSGASDTRAAIAGGACAAEVGSTISTQTGNEWGPIQQALDARIGSNTQSFDDVFLYDESTDRYIVQDPESPRVSVVPVIENLDGSTLWPSGTSPVRIVGYVFVYIGKTTEFPYPPYTASDKTAWVTPVRAVLPEEMDVIFGDAFDPDNDSPVQFRLVD